jgi:hypothetical protein
MPWFMDVVTLLHIISTWQSCMTSRKTKLTASGPTFNQAKGRHYLKLTQLGHEKGRTRRGEKRRKNNEEWREEIKGTGAVGITLEQKIALYFLYGTRFTKS